MILKPILIPASVLSLDVEAWSDINILTNMTSRTFRINFFTLPNLREAEVVTHFHFLVVINQPAILHVCCSIAE